MSFSRQLAPLALGFSCLSLGACQEDPSFLMQWRVASELEFFDDAMVPQSIAECTHFGLGGVRIKTTSAGITFDERDIDCYSDGPATGPKLKAGEYEVEVTGLRRNGTQWACTVVTGTPEDDNCEGAAGCSCDNNLDCDEGLSCAIIEDSNVFSSGDGDGDGDGDDTTEAPFKRICHPCSARHTQLIVVEEGEQLSLESTLLSPPQCDDGIDNDLDGLTDLLDPACARDPEADESADQSDTVVNLTVTFLNDNPNANCDVEAADAYPLDVVAFRSIITLDGEEIDSRVLACQRELAVYSLVLAPGDYELSLTGYDLNPDLEESAIALTSSRERPFTVSENNGGFVGELFDFDGEHFLTPMTGSISFSSNFEIGGGIENTGLNRGCEPVGNASSSDIIIEEIAVKVLDGDGEPVDPVELGLGLVTDPDDDEKVIIPCPADGNQSVTTSSLLWGVYTVEVEGRIGGVTCFSDELKPIPNKQLSHPIERVLDEGVPPAGCEDCLSDEDCPATFGTCVDGICIGNG